MPKKKQPLLPLFPNLEVHAPQPTGSVWETNTADPATVPVPLQVIIHDVSGPYKEMDRKLWTFLLHDSWDDLGIKQLHERDVGKITQAFSDLGADHNSDWVWESAKRLSKTHMSFSATFDDPRFDEIEGHCNMLNALVSRQRRVTRTLVYEFPAVLLPIIKQPTRFARLRIHFLIKLSGKYAVTMYEILEGFVNQRSPKLNVEIDQLRQWLKVPEGSYSDWKDLKKWVLDPSIQQINDDPEGAGFSVTYVPHRKGRSYHSLTFTMAKVESRKVIDLDIRRRIRLAEKIEKAGDRPMLTPDAYEKARAKANGLDVHALEKEFWAMWVDKGKPKFDKSATAAFLGFCAYRGKQ